MIDYVKDGDKLFRNDLSDIANDAILNYHFKDFYPYADGYRIAANNLLQSCLFDLPTNGRGDIDVLVFPIVFNYRHYAELRLKEIILSLRACNDDDKTQFNAEHNIHKLWNELKKLYQDFNNPDNENDFKNVERVLLELHAIDKGSFNFRYPVNKADQATLKMPRFNLINFGEVMERSANFLDALSDEIDYYKNA